MVGDEFIQACLDNLSERLERINKPPPKSSLESQLKALVAEYGVAATTVALDSIIEKGDEHGN